MTVAAERELVIGSRRYRFTADEFAHMGQAGIFAAETRVELIDGEILEMTPIGPPHAWIVDRLTEILVTRLAGKAHVRVQSPVRLDSRSQPQPDLAIARRSGSYAARHPEPRDVLLLIEVADSSLRYDRLEKVPRYGRAGIPETWLVDVEARAVTIHSGPGPDGYARQQVRKRGDRLAATSVPALGFPVDDVFGE